MNDSSGIIFVATGEKYAELTVAAIRQIRLFESVNICIFCDVNTKEFYLDIPNVQVEIIESPSFSVDDKMYGMEHAPFERSVFLDCDILCVQPFFNDMISALDYVDVLARSAGIAFNFEWERELFPSSLPQFNTGVIAFKKSRCKELFTRWRYFREKYHMGHDQPSFRAAVLDTRTRFGELASEFNFLPSTLAVSPPRLIHCIYDKELILTEKGRKLVERRVAARDIPGVYWMGIMITNKKKPRIKGVAMLVGIIASQFRKKVVNRSKRIVKSKIKS